MSEWILESIDTQIATLTRVVATPAEPFGYGVDTSGITDWTDTLDEVDAFTPQAISQALARRLQTPRGTLQDDGMYGLDVRGYLNRPVTSKEARSLEGEVRAEVRQDDRVAEVAVTVTFESQKLLRVKLDLTPEDAVTGGPFTLTLAVTSGAVLMESIRAAT